MSEREQFLLREIERRDETIRILRQQVEALQGGFSHALKKEAEQSA